MNFVNRVIFGNKNKKQPIQSGIDFEQYSSFQTEASLLEMSGNKKEMIFEECYVTFVKDRE